LLLKVHLDDKVFTELCYPLCDSLTVKLLEKNIILKKVWHLARGFELMDMGHGFFMVKFNQEMDRIKVMNDEPYMIFDHYLTFRTWSPSFVSTTAKINWTLVWARIPELNFVFYDEGFLLALGLALGTPIKVDINTVNVTRGKFVLAY